VIASRLGRGWLRLVAVAALAGALYGPTLGNDLVWDDRLTAAAPADPGTILFHATGAYYRPVVMLSFAADRYLWHGAAAGFHATNVVCHVAVGWLVGAWALALGAGGGTSLAAALVFVAHPVQTEAVAYVSGRTDILCALFVLLGLLAWRRARAPADGFACAATTAFVLALLSKESAILVPLALLLPGAHPAPRPPRPVLPLAASGVWLLLWAMRGGPGIHLGGVEARLGAIAVTAVEYLRLLVWPSDLHLERFTPVAGWSAPGVAAAWLVVAAAAATLAAAAVRVPGGPVLLGVAVLAYLPVSGVVPVYPAIADRALFAAEHFLYLPLVGLAPLVTGAVAAAWPARFGRMAPAVVAALLAAWGVVVTDRVGDWHDEETLFRDTLRYAPPAGRVWFDLGNLRLAAGDLAEARTLYEAAIARDPRDAAAHLNLGIVLQRLGRRADAEAQYRRALALDPALVDAFRRRPSADQSR
jgi:protein O-mannosyl-transferase